MFSYLNNHMARLALGPPPRDSPEWMEEDLETMGHHPECIGSDLERIWDLVDTNLIFLEPADTFKYSGGNKLFGRS